MWQLVRQCDEKPSLLASHAGISVVFPMLYTSSASAHPGGGHTDNTQGRGGGGRARQLQKAHKNTARSKKKKKRLKKKHV